MNVTASIRRDERLLEILVSFGELMKPELTGLSVLTALFGFYLADGSEVGISHYIGLALATMLVGGGAGALNQWIERDFDLLMKRTERRPLPSGRIPHAQALLFGILTTLAGNGLLFFLFGFLAGILGMATSLLYLFVYTPLKRRTWHNTTVGAIPGAFPVLIGWAARGESLGIGAWLLFGVVFIWQFPHFLSLAWLYRKDYAKAGFQMLSVLDSDEGLRTSRLNLLLSLGLAGVSWGLGMYEGFGSWYVAGALLSNGILCFTAFRAYQASTLLPSELVKVNRGARFLFFASLLYLPLLMGSVLIDRM